MITMASRQKVKTRRQVEEIWMAKHRLEALNNIQNFEFLELESERMRMLDRLRASIRHQIYVKYDVIL
ncbi:hypothetical protein [Paenibacillus oryzisoli]|uniref:Uncharacterized protein n=1 Tax=Paenibacillus oryzisoli TaxID=1850517 RepID=A0A198AF80_9BACL|nr:hypothetical protein [Paenibacillus oryzisoli]OAS19725.1 hypothetical protein A8708_26235 [Paenibacillus oryzisoli]